MAAVNRMTTVPMPPKRSARADNAAILRPTTTFRDIECRHGAWADLLNSPNQDLAFRTWMNFALRMMTLPTATPVATPTSATTLAPVLTSSLAPSVSPTVSAVPSDSPAAAEPSATQPMTTGASATETPVVPATPAGESGPGAGSSSSSAAPIAAAAVAIIVGLAGGLLLVLLRRRRRAAEE